MLHTLLSIDTTKNPDTQKTKPFLCFLFSTVWNNSSSTQDLKHQATPTRQANPKQTKTQTPKCLGQNSKNKMYRKTLNQFLWKLKSNWLQQICNWQKPKLKMQPTQPNKLAFLLFSKCHFSTWTTKGNSKNLQHNNTQQQT